MFENGNPVGFMILKRDQGELHLTLQPVTKLRISMLPTELPPFRPDSRHKQKGARIIKSLQDEDYGLRAFVVEDPDGNRIDVGQFKVI